MKAQWLVVSVGSALCLSSCGAEDDASCLPEFAMSFGIEHCVPAAESCELELSGSCTNTEVVGRRTKEPCPTGISWGVGANRPGRCVVVLTVDGQPYEAQIDLVEVRRCPSKYGPADGYTVVRLGPDCASGDGQ